VQDAAACAVLFTAGNGRRIRQNSPLLFSEWAGPHRRPPATTTEDGAFLGSSLHIAVMLSSETYGDCIGTLSSVPFRLQKSCESSTPRNLMQTSETQRASRVIRSP
jgi:hypothetical protein